MEDNFREAVQFVLDEWDSNPTYQTALSRHEAVGLTADELERFLTGDAWPENAPLLRQGVVFLLQPSYVRGEVPLWFDYAHFDSWGELVAFARGNKEYLTLLAKELYIRESATPVVQDFLEKKSDE